MSVIQVGPLTAIESLDLAKSLYMQQGLTDEQAQKLVDEKMVAYQKAWAVLARSE